MEEPQYRPRINTMARDADMDELLSNGFWKSSRAKAQASTNHLHSSIPSSSVSRNAHHYNTTRTTNSRLVHGRNYRKPVCEDELQSLSREVSSAGTSVTSLLDYEPPARGTIDQHPVLLEADLSTADALEYENQSREEAAWEYAKNTSNRDSNEERRFVFIPRDTTYSPFVEPATSVEQETHKRPKEPTAEPKSPLRERGTRDEERRSEKTLRETSRERRESRERKEVREKHYNKGPERSKRPQNARNQTFDVTPPSISRHRSRQDLPTLKTEIHQEVPPFQRSVSDYSVSSQSPERRRREASQPQRGEYLLSPLSPLSGRSQSKAYFDHVPRRFPGIEEQSPRNGVSEERGGDLLSPKSATFPREKRVSSAEDHSSSRKYSNEKLSIPQVVPGENSRRSHRDSSPLPRKYQVKPIDHSHTPNSPSNDSKGTIYYVSSEDESLTDDEPVFHRQHDREYDRDRDYHRPHHHRHHHRQHSSSKHLEANYDRDDRHRRSASKAHRDSLEVKPTSRYTSPLPSPNESPTRTPLDFRVHDTIPMSRDVRQDTSRSSSSLNMMKMMAATYASTHSLEANPTQERPISRRTSPSSEATIKSPRSSAHSLSIPMPVHGDIRSSTESLRSPNFDESNRKTPVPRSPGYRTPQNEKPFWQPSPFYFEDHSSQKPVGAYRRYSEDIDQGITQRLPDCPRTTPTTGKNDWLTLQGCPSFDICPTCFKSTMSKTEFASQFVPSHHRSDEEVICAFGSCTWYRIAWLLTLKEGRKDLRMFQGIARVNHDVHVQACLGPHPAIRPWHSILDPATNKPVEGFNVCPSCVQSIETILPPLKGIFMRKASYSGEKTPVQKKRICDMRFDSPRFIKYFDTLENTADTAVGNFMPPNTSSVVSLARRYAALDECPQDQELYNQKWHYITQLPEFTVCPECYEDVVRPLRKEGWPIPKMFDREGRKVERARCCLTGQREKEWFREAVGSRGGEFSGFARSVREGFGRV